MLSHTAGDTAAPITGSQPGCPCSLSSPQGLSQDTAPSRGLSEEPFCGDEATLA